jgi:hypothetical protein
MGEKVLFFRKRAKGSTPGSSCVLIRDKVVDPTSKHLGDDEFHKEITKLLGEQQGQVSHKWRTFKRASAGNNASRQVVGGSSSLVNLLAPPSLGTA